LNNIQWNPELYDTQHQYVSNYGVNLIDLLNPKKGELILDLGCGTGMLTHEISQRGARVIGIDMSLNMINKAKVNYPHLSFQVADGENFFFEEKVDAVFSNAALHWMQAPKKVISCVWECLKEKGRFVFEFGGKNNIQKVLLAIEKASSTFHLSKLPLENYYPSLGEYSSLLESQGFRVVYMQLFDRPTSLQGQDGLRNWVRMFRPLVLQRISPDQQDKFLAEVEKNAKESLYHESGWWADYVRLRGIAIKVAH
jgi:trans-aconitate methyltransferase